MEVSPPYLEDGTSAWKFVDLTMHSLPVTLLGYLDLLLHDFLKMNVVKRPYRASTYLNVFLISLQAPDKECGLIFCRPH